MAVPSADVTVLPNLPVVLFSLLPVLESGKSTPVSKVQVQPNSLILLLLHFEKI